MKIYQTNQFKWTVKKLHAKEKKLDAVLKKIVDQPEKGQQKKGDLEQVRVYKYKQVEKLILLAYTVKKDSITLLALASHENFYRDLKKI